MKKLFLTLALAFVGIFAANAQVWVGGGLDAQINKDNTCLTLSPEIGYAFNNHWQLALGAGYTMDKSDLGTANMLFLEPYVRYVGGTIGHKFSLFLDLTGDLDLGNVINATGDPMGWAVSLRPGIAWAATDKFTAAFRFGFAGYNRGFYKDEDGAVLPNGFFLNCETFTPEIRFYYSF